MNYVWVHCFITDAGDSVHAFDSKASLASVCGINFFEREVLFGANPPEDVPRCLNCILAMNTELLRSDHA
ncbi:MAG TPA: hypothetical protein VF077_01035 [Nitrospiraceae bacterium]